MCGESFAFWLFIILLFTSSSTTPRNFTSDNKEDNVWEETYNHTNLIKNKTNNDNNKNYTVPYEKCSNITCIQLCCPLGDRLVDENCIASENEYAFPNIYSYLNNSIQSGNKKVDELFPLIVQNPCQKTIRFLLYPDYYLKYFKYMFFANNSLYLPYFDIFVESSSHCLAVVDHNQFDAIICLEAVKETIDEKMDMIDEFINDILDEELKILYLSCRIVSTLCLLTTFVVYSILPELRNIHSFMLRKYCSLLCFGYIIEITLELLYPIDVVEFSYFICIILVLFDYFCSLSSFFWLSAMSFDVWWTFRDFRLLQRNMRAKQERKKLIYSIFAWGGPFFFTIICIIMDFVPNVPENFRPEFCVYTFWFYEDVTYLLYFYGPISICIISSVCLSIYTALKIMRYEKDTARRLRDSESRFYNDNKRWLSLYLKLFIMLFIIIAINWIISTANGFWQTDDYDVNLFIKLLYVHRSMYVINTMQDIGMFIIFVCKKTIMRQLLKRFCQNCKRFSKTSNRSYIK